MIGCIETKNLNGEFDVWVENGGYGDYNSELGENTSKTYTFRITLAEVNTVVNGYLKCMAAGTMKDIWSAYDMALVMW